LKRTYTLCILKKDVAGITIRVRVQPGASRNEIVGIREGALCVRLTSPPVEGAANKECIRFLSKKLHIAKSNISIIRGERSRNKVLQLEGVKPEELEKAIG
jgi:uncharacterized protein (TIGR00251 family)